MARDAGDRGEASARKRPGCARRPLHAQMRTIFPSAASKPLSRAPRVAYVSMVTMSKEMACGTLATGVSQRRCDMHTTYTNAFFLYLGSELIAALLAREGGVIAGRRRALCAGGKERPQNVLPKFVRAPQERRGRPLPGSGDDIHAGHNELGVVFQPHGALQNFQNLGDAADTGRGSEGKAAKMASEAVSAVATGAPGVEGGPVFFCPRVLARGAPVFSVGVRHLWVILAAVHALDICKMLAQPRLVQHGLFDQTQNGNPERRRRLLYEKRSGRHEQPHPPGAGCEENGTEKKTPQRKDRTARQCGLPSRAKRPNERRRHVHSPAGTRTCCKGRPSETPAPPIRSAASGALISDTFASGSTW